MNYLFREHQAHTHKTPRSGSSHLRISRAAGGHTDGDWRHCSHQDMEPISTTQTLAVSSALCTH